MYPKILVVVFLEKVFPFHALFSLPLTLEVEPNALAVFLEVSFDGELMLRELSLAFQDPDSCDVVPDKAAQWLKTT